MTQRVNPANRSKIEEAFWDFHRAHPEVYRELVRISRRLLAQGWTHFSINTVFEVARYKSMVGDDKGKSPRLNNNHRAYFARLIAREEPDLRDVFRTRKLATSHHRVP
jgi:hypothetical protein